jgi:hypothetical protein
MLAHHRRWGVKWIGVRSGVGGDPISYMLSPVPGKDDMFPYRDGDSITIGGGRPGDRSLLQVGRSLTQSMAKQAAAPSTAQYRGIRHIPHPGLTVVAAKAISKALSAIPKTSLAACVQPRAARNRFRIRPLFPPDLGRSFPNGLVYFAPIANRASKYTSTIEENTSPINASLSINWSYARNTSLLSFSGAVFLLRSFIVLPPAAMSRHAGNGKGRAFIHAPCRRDYRGPRMGFQQRPRSQQKLL